MIKLKDLLKENPADYADKNADDVIKLLRRKQKYDQFDGVGATEAKGGTPNIKKVKNVSVQYFGAEYVGEMTFSGYFRKAWLYKKDNGEWFAVIITKNKNRYEIQLGKHKDKLGADKAAEKLIKRSLNKFESVNEADKKKIKIKGKWKHNKLPWMRGPKKKNEADLPTTTKRDKTVKAVHKKSGKEVVYVDTPSVRKKLKRMGFVVKESINEAPGKNWEDQYYGAARVKVEPYTYKNQKRNFHEVSMYRDHKKPYHYYLSIRLAHSNKVDMVVSTGTHIQSKAGKWAQGFIKRRVGGTGKERFG